MEFSDQFLKRFEIVRPLGRGGMGEVFLARVRASERMVAIKTVQEAAFAHAGAKERFLREAKITAHLSHPNIIKVQDHGEDQGRLYIAFDFVEGGDLQQLLRKDGPLAPERFFQLAIPVLDAVAYAHAQGVLHRDIKAANIFLDAAQTPFVADFGLAKGGDDEGLRTATGMIMGTPRYMAPELGKGERASVESDQYALGILLFEMLAGRAPYDSTQPLALLKSHCDDPLPSLAAYRHDVPGSLEAAIAKSLGKARFGRHRTVEAFRDALIEIRDAGEPWVSRRPNDDAATMLGSSGEMPIPGAPASVSHTSPTGVASRVGPVRRGTGKTPVLDPNAPAGGATVSGQFRRTGQVRRPTSKSMSIVLPPEPPRYGRIVAVVMVVLLAAGIGAWGVVVARRGDTRYDALEVRVARGRASAVLTWSAERPARRVRVLRDGAVAAEGASTSSIRVEGLDTGALNFALEADDASGVTHRKELPVIPALTVEGVLAELRRIREVPDPGTPDETERKLPLEQRFTRRFVMALTERQHYKAEMNERYSASPLAVAEATRKSGLDRVLEWYRDENLEGVLEQAAAVMDGGSWKQKAEIYALAHRIAALEAFCVNSHVELPIPATRFLAALGPVPADGEPPSLAGTGDFSRTSWWTRQLHGHVPVTEAEDTYARGIKNPASGARTLLFDDALQSLAGKKRNNQLLELADAMKSNHMMAVEFAPATASSIQGMAVAEPLVLEKLLLPPQPKSPPARGLRVYMRVKGMEEMSHLDLTWGSDVVLCFRVPPGVLKNPTKHGQGFTQLSEIDIEAVAGKGPPVLTAHCDPSDVMIYAPDNQDAFWRTSIDWFALAYRY